MIIDSQKVLDAKEFCITGLPPCHTKNGLNFIEDVILIERHWPNLPKNGFLVPKHQLSNAEIVNILDKIGLFEQNHLKITGTASGQFVRIMIKN